MFVILQQKLAFLAVPKTGTTSIERALRGEADIIMRKPPQVKHMTVMTFESFIRPYLKKIGAADVKTLAVMRHPIDQLESWYFYRRRDGGGERAAQNSTKNITWAEFIEAYLSENPPKYARMGTQSQFLGCDDGSDPKVDYIFPFEKMPDLISFLEKRFGESLGIEQRNSSKREPASLPPELHARLCSALSLDIALHQRVLNKEFYPE